MCVGALVSFWLCVCGTCLRGFCSLLLELWPCAHILSSRRRFLVFVGNFSVYVFYFQWCCPFDVGLDPYVYFLLVCRGSRLFLQLFWYVRGVGPGCRLCMGFP